MNNIIILFNIYKSGGQAGNVLSINGVCSSLIGYGAGGGGKEPMVITYDNRK